MSSLVFVPRGPALFRENRSFTIGGVARAVDPPPSVFFGALRTSLLVQQGIDFDRYRDPPPDDKEVRDGIWAKIGSPTEPGELCMRGPFPYYNDEWFFPPPENRFAEDHLALPSDAGTGALTDLYAEGLRPLRVPRVAKDGPKRLWMPTRTLLTYLLAAVRDDAEAASYLEESESWDGQLLEALFEREPRFGHARDPITLRPKERHLFSLEMLRPNDSFKAGRYLQAAWAVVVDGLDESRLPKGSVRVGGRGRRCDLRLGGPPPNFDAIRSALLASLSARRRCFLYLATPALFQSGWQPPGFPGLQLVAAALGRPTALGGWDLAARRPRTTLRMVPAGSVYFLEGEPDESWAAFLDSRQFKPISDYRAEAGFGTALVGAW